MDDNFPNWMTSPIPHGIDFSPSGIQNYSSTLKILWAVKLYKLFDTCKVFSVELPVDVVFKVFSIQGFHTGLALTLATPFLEHGRMCQGASENQLEKKYIKLAECKNGFLFNYGNLRSSKELSLKDRLFFGQHFGILSSCLGVPIIGGNFFDFLDRNDRSCRCWYLGMQWKEFECDG